MTSDRSVIANFIKKPKPAQRLTSVVVSPGCAYDKTARETCDFSSGSKWTPTPSSVYQVTTDASFSVVTVEHGEWWMWCDRDTGKILAAKIVADRPTMTAIQTAFSYFMISTDGVRNSQTRAATRLMDGLLDATCYMKHVNGTLVLTSHSVMRAKPDEVLAFSWGSALMQFQEALGRHS